MSHTIIERDRYNSRSNKRIKYLNLIDLNIVGAQQERIPFSSPYLFFENLIDENINSNHEVLDLCAGDGCYSSYIAKRCKKIYCTDISKESLKIAKLRAKNLKLTNIIFKEMNAEKINFKKNKFDVVTMVSSLSYVNLNITLNEILRVLKKDGKMIIVDSFNHNVFYRLNRYFHYLKGNRSFYTIKNCPNNKSISIIKEKFRNVKIYYFGIFAFMVPIFKLFMTLEKSKKLVDKLDKNFHFFKKFSFKIVINANS